MDKAAIIPNKETALEIIGQMRDALQKYGVNPCQIALFGSFLNGNNHAESDIDMLIISDSFKGKNISERIKMTLKAQSEVRKRYVVPMDILLKTSKEYKSQQYFESKIII